MRSEENKLLTFVESSVLKIHSLHSRTVNTHSLSGDNICITQCSHTAVLEYPKKDVVIHCKAQYSHNTEPLKIQHIVVHLKDLIPIALLIHNSTFKTAWIVIGFILQETIEEPKFVDLHAASQM